MGVNFNIVLPTSWKELTDEQLIALFRLLAQQLTSEEIKTLLLVKWNKLRILAQRGRHEIPSKREQSQTSLSFAEREVFGGSQFLLKAKKTKPFFVSAVQIQYATTVLDFIDTIPDMPICISKMCRHQALQANFEGVPFEKFLYLDNLFQGYLQTQKEDLIVQMTQILNDTDKKRIPKHFLVGAFYWFAALKKQQQAAEAQGYAVGGFTPEGDENEPAGIVHKGEWVASQRLLRSPVARPMIEALDYAQRTNTIGSLRQADVSRSIAPAIYAHANTPPIIIQNTTTPQEEIIRNSVAMREYTSVIRELKERLSEPFVTVNTVTGDSGIKQAQDEYNKLMRNKTPKNRRK